ncbi:MAG: DUF2723 domain-containing protein [Candidatus Doudnabacteria bacterium]|nr:DUF2723 domain-containing protein [Candidatus Doudnabacteria bacterium]
MAQIIKMKISMRRAYAGAVFLATFLAYFFTAARTVFLGDAGEFITAGVTGGIPHPSGYPLYSLVAWLFSFFPISTVALRVGLVSVLAASAGLAIFYLVLVWLMNCYRRKFPELFRSESALMLVSFLVCLMLAFSGIFWSQAIIAEVYGLNFFFLVLLLWLLIRLWETRQIKFLFWGAFFFGLGLGNHQMLLLFLPVFVAGAWAVPVVKSSRDGAPRLTSFVRPGGLRTVKKPWGSIPAFVRPPKADGTAAGLSASSLSAPAWRQAGNPPKPDDVLPIRASPVPPFVPRQDEGLRAEADKFLTPSLFLLGLAVYVYLPLRSYFGSLLDSGETSKGILEFLVHVSRASYGDFGIGAIWPDKLYFFWSFVVDVYHQFGVLTLWAILGFLVLIRVDKKFFLMTVWIFFANSLGIILLRNLVFTPEAAEFYSYYYLPAYAMAAFWIALGILEIYRLFTQFMPAMRKVLAGGAALIVLFVVQVFFTNLPQNSLAKFQFIENHSGALLSGLAPNAVLIFSHEGPGADTLLFSLVFQQFVHSLRPDVIFVAYPDQTPRIDRKALAEVYTGKKDLKEIRRALVEFALAHPDFAGRPIYTTFMVEGLNFDKDWQSRSNGLAYLLTSGEKENDLVAKEGLGQGILTNMDREILANNYFGADFLAQYYYAQAAFWAARGDEQRSQQFFRAAAQVDHEPLGVDSVAYQLLRDRELAKAHNL